MNSIIKEDTITVKIKATPINGPLDIYSPVTEFKYLQDGRYLEFMLSNPPRKMILPMTNYRSISIERI